MNETVTPPPASAAPVSVAPSGSDKIWAILCHIGFLSGVGFILLPLIVYLAMKNDSAFVAEHSREALNFHLSVLIYCIVAGILSVIGIGLLLMVVIGLGTLILGILAALKASESQPYRYPLTIRLVS